MLFNSWQYALFLGVVLIAYYLLPRKAQNGLLLIASYVFYAVWDVRFVLLLLVSTALDYACGAGVHRASSPARRTRGSASPCTKRWGALSSFT